MNAAALIRLHANDNVLIARDALSLGQNLPELGLRVRAQVPAGAQDRRLRHCQGHARYASSTP
ncbi:hypothetical protein ACU4GD_40990 [Cupriavidus basilensis]